MKEIHKQWSIDMIDNELEERETINNEHLWWLGSGTSEEREMHRANILEHNNYMDVLYKIKNLVM